MDYVNKIAAMQHAREAAKASKEPGAKRLTPIEKLALKPKSKAYAIKAMCFQCMGAEPGWRKLVDECSSTACALYALRPCRQPET